MLNDKDLEALAVKRMMNYVDFCQCKNDEDMSVSLRQMIAVTSYILLAIHGVAVTGQIFEDLIGQLPELEGSAMMVPIQ